MSIHLLEGQEYTETHRFDIMRNLARDGAFYLAVSCKLFIISQLCGHVKNLCLALFEMHICSVLRSGLGGHQAVAHRLAQAKTAWLGARVPAQASAFSILFQNFIKKNKNRAVEALGSLAPPNQHLALFCNIVYVDVANSLLFVCIHVYLM